MTGCATSSSWPLRGVITTLYYLLDLLVLTSSISIVLNRFLLVRMVDSIEVGLANLRCLSNTAIHISLYSQHVHRLNCFQLLIIHILYSTHLVLLFFRSMMLHRTLLTVLILLIVLVSGDLVRHLQIKFLLICNCPNIQSVSWVPNDLLVLLILSVMHCGPNWIVTAPYIGLWFAWELPLHLLLILIKLNTNLTLRNHSFQRMAQQLRAIGHDIVHILILLAIALIQIHQLNLLVTAILVREVWHLGAEASAIRIISIVWLGEYLVIAYFATHIVLQNHGVSHVQLLVNEWLHANIQLALLLTLKLHSFFESGRHARLLDHYNVGVLPNWLLYGLRIGSLIELRHIFGLLNTWVIGNNATLVDIEIWTADTLLLATNVAGAHRHYGVVMILLEANGATGHVLVHLLALWFQVFYLWVRELQIVFQT